MFSDLRQHHIGCLVSSIDDFKDNNKAIWSEDDYSEVFHISSQDVKVCFIKKTGGIEIELVEPGAQNKPLTKLLSKGLSYYHLAFTSKQYDASVDRFKEAEIHQLVEFVSEAFNNKRCSFFYHNELKLIELIEVN